MILVTGAAGKTGRALVQALATDGWAVRALVRRAEQRALLQADGAQEVVLGDFHSAADLNQACRGVASIYHICPNMQPAEVAIGQRIIAAAQANGVRRFVYHSVLRPQIEEMLHHWNKLRVEELLFKSGLAFTILQPAAYMQNVLAGWPTIVEQGLYRVPYAVTTRLGMVDLLDVATVAAKVLTEAGHSGAIYELAGAEALSQLEVAAILTEGLGRPVRAEALDPAAWERTARANGLNDYAVTTLRSMFAYYERYGFWGNPHVLTTLLGRVPTTFAAFVKRQQTQ